MRPSLDPSPTGKARGWSRSALRPLLAQTRDRAGAWLQLAYLHSERWGTAVADTPTCSPEEPGQPGLVGVALANVPIPPTQQLGEGKASALARGAPGVAERMMARPNLPAWPRVETGGPEPPPSEVGTWDLPGSRLHVPEQ